MTTPPRSLVTAERRDDEAADASLWPQRLSKLIRVGPKELAK